MKGFGLRTWVEVGGWDIKGYIRMFICCIYLCIYLEIYGDIFFRVQADLGGLTQLQGLNVRRAPEEKCQKIVKEQEFKIRKLKEKMAGIAPTKKNKAVSSGKCNFFLLA